MDQKLLALFGLKYNPFSTEIPTEAIYISAKLEHFCLRVQHALIREGGFALIQGDPGCGKSVVLRFLAERLSRVSDVVVGIISHPQSSLVDFYRELGDIFSVPQRANNRWGGFKDLRERWLAHMESTRLRPILIIDEAQEMMPQVLNELRLLATARFDSQPLLCTIMAGDARLNDKLRHQDLVPLGSRIRLRLNVEYATRDELGGCLKHLMESAGNASLMTPGLCDTLCDHAAGNFRVMTHMAHTLLAEASIKELAVLDEKLFLETFPPSVQTAKRSRR